MSKEEFTYDFSLAPSEYKEVIYDYIENGHAPPVSLNKLGDWLADHEKEKIQNNVFLKRFCEEEYSIADNIYYDFKLGWVLEKENAKTFLGKALLPLGVTAYLGHCSYFSGRSWIRGRGTLEIGNFTCIANNCVIDTSPREHPRELPAHINWSNNPRVRHLGLAVDWCPDPQEYGVRIGNDVWLGEMVTLKSGIGIGDGSAVGRAGLVLKDVPRYEIWGGVPAKKIRDRYSPEIVNEVESRRWWYFTDEQLQHNEVFFRTLY